MTALRGIDVRLRLARLFCVTDTRRLSNDLVGFATAVMAAGVDVIQLRDDRVTDSERLSALDVLRTAALRRQGLVSVYADPELAGEFGADVLQLPKGRPDAAQARLHLHRWAKLGRACYTTSDVDDALADPEIDFLTVGPVFGGLPLFGRPPGLELIRHATSVAPPARKGSKPWFAIGGITMDNLDAVIGAGARRVVVGRAITAANDPAAAARAFGDRLRAAWGPESEEFILDALSSQAETVADDPATHPGPDEEPPER